MTSVFSPSVVSPPIEKNTACSSRATSTAGKAAQPSTRPISPVSTRWTEVRERHLDQRGHEEGRAEHGHLGQPLVVELVQPDGRAHGRAAAPANSTTCPCGVPRECLRRCAWDRRTSSPRFSTAFEYSPLMECLSFCRHFVSCPPS